MPSSWKQGGIVPIRKKDCTLKVFEKLFHSRLASHFEDVNHNNVFAYRDYHGCDTAILSLTEEFKKELDNHKVISLVSMDLSKAFDTFPMILLSKSLKITVETQKVISLVTNYMTDSNVSDLVDNTLL